MQVIGIPTWLAQRVGRRINNPEGTENAREYLRSTITGYYKINLLTFKTRNYSQNRTCTNN